MKFISEAKDPTEPSICVEVKQPAGIGDVLNAFEEFLRACNYIADEHVKIVDKEKLG